MREAQTERATAPGIIAAQDTDDPRELLKRLMKDRDPAIRLRAINAYLDLDGKQGCPTCARYAQNTLNIDRIVQYATDEQANEMRAHIGVIKAHVVSIKAIKAKVLDYIAAGGTPHEEEISHGSERQHDQSAWASAAVPVAPTVERPAAETRSLDEILYEGDE